MQSVFQSGRKSTIVGLSRDLGIASAIMDTSSKMEMTFKSFGFYRLLPLDWDVGRRVADDLAAWAS